MFTVIYRRGAFDGSQTCSLSGLPFRSGDVAIPSVLKDLLISLVHPDLSQRPSLTRCLEVLDSLSTP